MDELKSCVYENSVVISSCYTVCGIDNKYKYEPIAPNPDSDPDSDADQNPDLDSVLSLTLKVILKEGISFAGFYDAFIEKIREDLGRIMNRELTEQYLRDTIKCSMAFGNADVVIIPEIDQKAFLNLFLDPYLFNPGQDFYKNHISDIRTTITLCYSEHDRSSDVGKICIDDSCTDKLETEELDTQLENLKTEWKEFIKDFEDKFLSNVYPSRNSKALQATMKNFINVAYSTHGFDMRKSILPVYESLIIRMKEFMTNKDSSSEIKEECLQTLAIFRDKVGDFLLDLIRSDKPFIEGNSLLHPSIGSSTKLLFAYTGILQKVATTFESKIRFLVMSGGTDRIVATDLFDFYRGEDNYKPVLISVPEMALYDFKGTLFRLLHECMHFCGDRKRALRYEILVNCMAEYISRDLAKLFYERRYDGHLENLKVICNHREHIYLKKQINRIVGKTRSMVQSKLRDFVKMDSYFESVDTEVDRNLYFINLISEKKGDEGILSSQQMSEEFLHGMLKQLFQIIREGEISCTGAIIEVLKDKGIDYLAISIFDFF